jgi:hypothetical protein
MDWSRTLSPVQVLAATTSLNHSKLPHKGPDRQCTKIYCSLSVARVNYASNFVCTGGLLTV